MRKNSDSGPLETAVHLLSRRDYSEQNMRGELKRNDFSAEEIDATINELKNRGYLDEERLKSRVLEKLIVEKRHGIYNIREKMRKIGFENVSQTELRQYYPEEAEWCNAVKLMERRFPAWQDEDFYRLARFLDNRGFSSEIISKLARECRKHKE